MAGEKILVVEDEKALLKVLKYNLEREGYRVLTASDGESGLDCFRKENPELLIVDVMLPKVSGFELCRAVRETSKIPLMMLTAKKEEVDRVLGLELGADDYVTKPFSVRELLARVRAILRRASQADAPTPALLRAGSIELDPSKYEVRVRGKLAPLSSKEFEFLKCLLEARGRALKREEILEKVWGYEKSMDLDTRTIDQHVARLREKLSVEADRLVTVKNVGYRIKTD
jgi:DNA-binding response OmpR family regulator